MHEGRDFGKSRVLGHGSTRRGVAWISCDERRKPAVLPLGTHHSSSTSRAGTYFQCWSPYTFREEIPVHGRRPCEEERDRTHGSRSGEALDE